MAIKFTKNIPDELYVDSFSKKLKKSYTYEGPESLKVLVDKQSGFTFNLVESDEDKFNPDFVDVVTVDATKNTDVAEYLYNTVVPERQFEDEIQVDGSVYKNITNPILRDYYNLRYDFETSSWVWIPITRNPASILTELAEKNKNFVTLNLDTVKDNVELTKVANDYIKLLDDFMTTGKGSIPSWKMDEFLLSSVPMIPQELIVAFNQLP
jgi:hypothetical protein